MNRSAFFAVQLWGNDLNVLDLFKEVESLGFDAAYYGDGPFDWLMDCYSVLSSASFMTEKIRIGPAVTYLDGSYRNPIAVAKALVTIAVLSKGRLDARFGFIKEEARPYWARFGINLPRTKERLERFEEALIIFKNLTREGKANFEGKYYKVFLNDFKPKIRIPICISAVSKRTIKIALTHADVWEISYLPFDDLEQMLSEYEIKGVELSLELDVVIGNDDLKRKYTEYLRIRGVEENHPIVKSALIGNADACIKKIQKYMGLGIKRFTLSFNEIPNLSGMKLFSKEVLNSF